MPSRFYYVETAFPDGIIALASPVFSTPGPAHQYLRRRQSMLPDLAHGVVQRDLLPDEWRVTGDETLAELRGQYPGLSDEQLLPAMWRDIDRKI